MALGLGGCSKVEFSSPPPDCVSQNKCAVTPDGLITYNYTVTTSSIPVDILFVNDNSGSMTVNQSALAARFSNFFNLISQFDYHIAMVTTNVVDANFPALQNGQLVSFGSGGLFLSPSSINPVGAFAQTVVRPETVACDGNYSTCPSQFSRGITAASLAIQANQGGFLRANAPLEIIVISNADENICGGPGSTCLDAYGNATANSPVWSANDNPNYLYSALNSLYPNKDYRIHTIVIQPGDSACWSAQNAGNGKIWGQYAPIYASLSDSTGGVKGSICAGDYAAQLTAIGNLANNQLMQNFKLNCKTNTNNLRYTLSPTPAGITGSVDTSGMNLVFSAPLPPSTTLQVTYTCVQ